jgi:tetratricopeptide (TPR) repeat protein
LDAQKGILRSMQGESASSIGSSLHTNKAFQKQIRKERQVVADLHMSLGMAYGASNKLKRAEEHFHKSLKTYQDIVDQEAEASMNMNANINANVKPILHTFAASANKVGNLFYRHLQFNTALTFYRLAQENPNYPVLPSTPTMTMAASYCSPLSVDTVEPPSSHLWQQETTEGILEKNLFLCRADTLNNMANVYNVTNQYAKAIPLYNQAIQIQTTILGPEEDSAVIFTTMHNIASCYCREGKLDMALKTYRKVISMATTTDGNGNTSFAQQERIVDSMAGIAVTLHSLGETHQAIQAYQEALVMVLPGSPSSSSNINADNYGPRHVKVAGLHNAIGELYQEVADPNKALEHFQQGYAIYIINRCHKKEPEMRRCRKNIKAMGFDPDAAKNPLGSRNNTSMDGNGGGALPLPNGVKKNHFASSEVVMRSALEP